MLPINPPEARPTVLGECEDCNGAGQLIDGEPCECCDGRGKVEYEPEEDPYAPDYWKDAL